MQSTVGTEKGSGMHKAEIKTFAVNTRNKLIESVKTRAALVGITEKGISAPDSSSSDSIVINGRVFNYEIKKQREHLVRKIERSGFSQAIDEVAYTWFNRFIALRFMEVNHYLDHDLNIISSLNPTSIASKAPVHLSLNREEIAQLVFDNKDEELYKRLIIAQCNALHSAMPFLFEKINDYTELLFPTGLLLKDSVLREMVETIPEEDWQEVEIIGWLYQYYISEKKEAIVGMDKGVIAKEDIPAATQLFTFKWIVQYMVQNSLGRLWYEMHPDTDLIKDWEYFLKPEPEDMTKREMMKLEDITFFDPCCGSGHILVYAFDLFYEMYKASGYLTEEIPQLIVRHNLHGLDICGRAVQLTGLSLMMKVRQHTKNIEGIRFNVYEFQDSHRLSAEALSLLCKTDKENKEITEVVEAFENAKSFGSLVFLPDVDYDMYIKRFNELDSSYPLFVYELKVSLLPVLRQARLLSRKYDVVSTNPPYLNKYNPEMKTFVESHYRQYKSDLFSAFIYKCNEMTKPEGYCAMMSPMTWMFIKTHEKLREYIIENRTITSLVHPEYTSFYSSAIVPIMIFVAQNSKKKRKGIFVDLNNFVGEDIQAIKLQEAAINKNVRYKYTINSQELKSIPGMPIAYWASEKVKEIFRSIEKLESIGTPMKGLDTADNAKFLKLWFEVVLEKIGFHCSTKDSAQQIGFKWFPISKGGSFRKWYGNNEYVINWENDGYEIKKLKRATIRNQRFYFKEGITWTDISPSSFGVRYQPIGFLFETTGSCIFAENKYIPLLLSILCSKLVFEFLRILNPTMHFKVGNIASLPIIFPSDPAVKFRIDALAEDCISISRLDWDSFETSWDFQAHPFITHRPTWDQKNPTHKLSSDSPPMAGPSAQDGKIEDAFNAWKLFADVQFSRLKANEEELNRIFIEIYGLQDEMTPEVTDKDITIRKAELERDVRSFISYAVGCIMGRYSLDEPGLVFAGGTFEPSRYKTYEVDPDAILPVLGDVWFDDDIVTRFIEFVKTVFGTQHHSENIIFIAQALGKTDRESPEERIRKYFLTDFYKDHLKIYQKRPIYWLFTSGREKAFNALVYLHRYDKDTLARLRKDYLHELQAKLDREVKFLEEKNEKKKLSALYKQQEELRKYDELLKHYADQHLELDLDDGVVVNYAKFGKLVSEIK
ncbi:MAG: BREX-1 system adenine-specific DNA-methyltransferase PglX [Vulcanimicrobiota bacterium]